MRLAGRHGAGSRAVRGSRPILRPCFTIRILMGSWSQGPTVLSFGANPCNWSFSAVGDDSMTKKRTKRSRSWVWREIRGQFKREEVVKRIVGKAIDGAFNAVLAGIIAIYASFPKEFVADLARGPARVAQEQAIKS